MVKAGQAAQAQVRAELQRCKHPNSRKTVSLTKRVKRQEKRDLTRLAQHARHNLLGEKLLWFQQRLRGRRDVTKALLLDLIDQYIARYDEELEQIALKNSVGQRKSRQHASREDIIKITKTREKEEFDTCGIELPDLTDHSQMQLLESWNGELRFLQNFKLRRFCRKFLSE